MMDTPLSGPEHERTSFLRPGDDVPRVAEAPPGEAMLPVPGPLPPVRPTPVQIILFAATVLSTLVMYPLVQGVNPFAEPGALVDGFIFSSTLLTILGVHELAHFVVGRRYRVDVSLPYFIPAPNLLGTFGAVIRIRSPITNRRALLMIGAAGPIAGFLVAIPAVMLGVAGSEVQAFETESGILVGAPLVFSWVIELVHGGLGGDQMLNLNGMAFAGWAGLFLTAFNLLPLGQLDGGHVAYALLGRHTRRLALPVLALLIVMGSLYWIGWLILGVLVLVFGIRHPPVHDPGVGLGRVHFGVALACLLILAVCFTPVPVVVL